MNKMIIGKVKLENGEVLEREFDSVWDFILADALLGIECKENTGYEFYYGEQHIERLKETSSKDIAGFGDNLEPSFGEEITYLETAIKMIDNCKMFE